MMNSPSDDDVKNLRRHLSSFTLTESMGFAKVDAFGEGVSSNSSFGNDENRNFGNKDGLPSLSQAGSGVFGINTLPASARLKRCKSAYETSSWEHTGFNSSGSNSPWENSSFLQVPSPEDTEVEAKLSHQVIGLLESPRDFKGAFDLGSSGVSAATAGFEPASFAPVDSGLNKTDQKTNVRQGTGRLTRRATFSVFPAAGNNKNKSKDKDEKGGGAPEWSGSEESSEPSSAGSTAVKTIGENDHMVEEEPGSPEDGSGSGQRPMLRRVNSAELVRRAFPEMLFDRTSPAEETEHDLDLLAAAASGMEGANPAKSVASAESNDSPSLARSRQTASESVVSTAESVMSTSSAATVHSPVPNSVGAGSIDNNPGASVANAATAAAMQQQQQQQQQMDYMMRMQQMQAAAAAASAAGAAPGGQVGYDQSAIMQQQQFMMYMQQMMFMQQQAAQHIMGAPAGPNVGPQSMPGMMNVNMNMNLNVPFPQHLQQHQQQHGLPPGMASGLNMPPMGHFPHAQDFHGNFQNYNQQQQQHQHGHGQHQSGYGRQGQRASSPVPGHGGRRDSSPEPWQQQGGGQAGGQGLPVCSNLLAEHKHTGRKPSIAELKTHVLEFSKDSSGSRYLQEAMNMASIDEKFELIEEVKHDCLSVIQDLFGNYVMQNFLDHATDEQRIFIAKKMRGVLVQLSMHPHGCRVVQKVLELLGPDEVRMELLNELIMTPGNLELTGKDAHATHVLQKAVVVLQRDVYPTLEKRAGRGERFKKKSGGREPRRTQGSSSSELITKSKVLLKAVEDVVAANVMALAVNQHACRLVQRVLGDCDEQRSPCVSVMMKVLQSDYDKLARDQHGNFILQHILELGQQQQADAIQDHVSSRVVELSQHKFGSHLVEKCLITSNPAQASVIIEALLATDSEKLTRMMKDPYANFVLQRAYDVGSSFHKTRIAHEVEERADVLSSVQPGRHILSHLSRAKQQQH